MPRGARTSSSAPAYIGGVASRVQPGYSQTNVVLGFPIASAPRRRPRRHRRRGAVRRGHELAADGRDPRAARPRLLRLLLGRRQRAVRPVRHRGVDVAGPARRVPRRGAPPARRRVPMRSIRPSSSAHATRSRCAAARAGAAGRAASRTRRSTCFVPRPRALARRALRASTAVGGEDVRAVFARMLAAPPALAIAGRMKKGASERARALFALRRDRAEAPPLVVSDYPASLTAVNRRARADRIVEGRAEDRPAWSPLSTNENDPRTTRRHGLRAAHPPGDTS